MIQKMINSKLIYLILLIFISGCNQPNALVNETQQPTVYETIIKKKEIRVAYVIYPPASIINPNTGEMSGIFIDTVEEIGKRLDLKIIWAEEVDWGTMIEGLNAGRYDMVGTPVWKNTNRAKHADFSLPIYFDGVGIFTRANNTSFDKDISLLNSEKNSIISVDGGLGIEIAKYKFGNAKLITLPQGSDVNLELDWVAEGKADASLTSTSYAWDYQQKNLGKIKNVTLSNPVRVFPNVLMLPKKEHDFRRMINAGIEELHLNGFIESKIQEYTGKASVQYYNPPSPYTHKIKAAQ